MKLAKLLLVFVLIVPSFAWSQIYVATNGSDMNEGTKSKPFATVAMAVRKAREIRRLNDPSIKNGIDIIVENGNYRFSETLFIRPEDSGTEESPTIIKAAENAHPVFSGGVEIHGWKKLQSDIVGLPQTSKGKIWVADIPSMEGNFIPFRQLWMNGVKAIRAKAQNGDSMSRILSWDHQLQTCWIPKPKGIDLSSVNDAELFIHQWWAVATLRIKAMKMVGDSIQLSFYQPESRIESEHPWPAPWISKKTGNSAFYLVNAIQFLDEPGEWYADQKAGKIYYYPRSNENMSTASVVAPFLETLVKIEGTIDRPVSNIFFKSISFEHTGWLRPSQQGHVPLQAGMYLLDAYKLKIPGTPDKKGLENQAWIGRPAAAVEVSYANHTGFESCRFQHLASTGLDYKRGTGNDEIKSNLFKDIGGNGILIGTFSDEAFETHLPYNPKDEREICTNEYISNNLITDVSNEDWGTVGIGAGYVKGISIEHNEISNVSYTGISLGWGWTKTLNAMKDNHVFANKITHYAKRMYDVAGIYTLSAQPGTIISNNYIDSIYKAPYAHDPNHWFYLYTDEGSSYITVKNNWCPAEKFLQNANGPGNSWDNNGPGVTDTIKNLAGIEPAYVYLLKEKTVDSKWPINHVHESFHSYAARNKPVVIEIIGEYNQKLNEDDLLKIFERNGISRNDVYKWNNHFAGFAVVKDTGTIKKEMGARYPSAEVKIYSNPFYIFDRSKCSNQSSAKEWSNVLLTANLVSDPKLQKEYLNYHATQFEKWPEVSKGFCNADFQQLLVYKNGRQLMLIISIPKGKTLDELNPRTTEDNPGVDDWNNIMKKYQEGIEGTKPGEVWVFLKPVTEK